MKDSEPQYRLTWKEGERVNLHALAVKIGELGMAKGIDDSGVPIVENRFGALQLLLEDARNGKLPVLDGLTHSPRHDPDFLSSYVLLADLRPYLEGRGIQLLIEKSDGQVQLYASPNDAPKGIRVRNPRSESCQKIVHSTKGKRRDVMTPVIEHAQSLCRNPTDAAEVYASLMTLAKEKYGILLGTVEEGIQYTNAKGEAGYLSQESLKKRINRPLQKARPKSPRINP